MTNLTVTTEDGTFNVPADELSAELLSDIVPGREYTAADAGVFDDLVFELCEAVPGDGEFLAVTAA